MKKPAIDWNAAFLKGHERAGVLYRDVDLEFVAKRCQGRLSYLASPYSKLCQHSGAWDEGLSLSLGFAAARWVAELSLRGVTAMSPISQASMMVSAGQRGRIDPLGVSFWEGWCRPLLHACEAMIVPPIEGWDDSVGVWFEVQAALDASCPVYLLREGAA